MKLVIKEKSEYRLNKLLDSILFIGGYAIVLFLVDIIFNSFDVDNYFYFMLLVVLMYVLNKTVKPLIVRLTLPITALTFGLFYPILNVFVLYIASFILGDHFTIHGFILPILIAIVISILNMVMEGMIIKPIIGKGKVLR